MSTSTRSAKAQKSLEKDYRAFRNAMDKKNHLNVIKYGLRLVERQDFAAPPLIYRTIGEAYLFIATEREKNGYSNDENPKGNDKPKNKFTRKKSKEDVAFVNEHLEKAWPFLKKAYDCDMMNEPEKIVELCRVVLSDKVEEYIFAYDVLKKTLNETDCSSLSNEALQVLYEYFAKCCTSMNKIPEAINAHRQAFLLEDNVVGKASYFGRMLFISQYLPFTAEDLYEMHKTYNSIFDEITPYKHDLEAVRREIKDTGRKIRIGYVSPDCRHHVAMQFFIGLLEDANHDKFETFLYSLTQHTDFATEICQKGADHFIDAIDMSFEETAAKIHDDGIDILVDLAGHTSNNGLPIFAYKPAPIAMSGIGYLYSTGLKAIDYYITDKIVDPPGAHDEFFTEKPLYLTSQFSTNFLMVIDTPLNDEAPCRKKGYITFGSFNNYNKITDEMLLAWKKIMERVPNSRLILKANQYGNKDLLKLAKERFQNLGLDLSRIDFEPSSYPYAHRYLELDIALDTYPYTGGGTTCDALYMGVPVVTLYGERRNTRFSLGILTNIGLKYLAVDSIEKYIDMAVNLANDPDLLDTLHRKIRPMLKNSIVGQPERYTKELEQKYLEVLGLT